MIDSQFCPCFVQTRQWKTAVVLVLTLLLVLPLRLLAQDPVPQPNPGSLNFLVISDWGGKGGATQVTIAKEMGRTAATQKSSFVVMCCSTLSMAGSTSLSAKAAPRIAP